MGEEGAAWDLTVELIMGKKERANDLFNKGKYVDASILYANAIENLMDAEGTGEHKFPQNTLLNHLKPQLFLNLAIASYKMNAIEGSLKSCNTALIFCMRPELYLSDLGIDDDLNMDVPFDIETVTIREDLYRTTSKVLYRRGLCKKAKLKIKSSSVAIEEVRLDFRMALYFLPKDTVIQNALNELGPTPTSTTSSSSSSSGPPKKNENSTALAEADIHYMTVNGGKCLLRKALWSQTTTEAKIYVPIAHLLKDLNMDLKREGEESLEIALHTRGWKVEFSSSEVKVLHEVYGVTLHEPLEYDIKKDESMWMVECTEENGSGELYMVLYLQKVPSLETFPGCEWWDRVFKSDEPIDTLTCTIGTDGNDLPDHAYRRSHIEHARFMALSKEEREKELNDLVNVRNIFGLTEEKIREAAEQVN